MYRQTALQMKNFYLYLIQVKTLCNKIVCKLIPTGLAVEIY